MKELLIALGILGVCALLSPLTTNGAMQTATTFGQFPYISPAGATQATFAMTTNNFATANIFRTTVATSVGSIGFLVTARSAPNTTVTVAVENVSSTTGFPNGTVWNAGASTTVLIDGTGWFSVTLPTPATLVAGDLFAVTVRMPGSGGGSVTVQRAVGGQAGGVFPYTATNNATTWTKQSGGINAFYLGDANGNALQQIYNFPLFAITNKTISLSQATSNEWGMVFQFPFPVQICGAQLQVRSLSASSTFTLYDNNNVEITSTTSDLNNQFSTQGAPHFNFFAPVTIPANTQYRYAVRGTQPGNNVFTWYDFVSTTTFSSQEYWNTFQVTSRRTTSSVWTDQATSTGAGYLQLCGFDDGVQTGGTTITPLKWTDRARSFIDEAFAVLDHAAYHLASLLGKLSFALR